jgi:hypothetical protein
VLVGFLLLLSGLDGAACSPLCRADVLALLPGWFCVLSHRVDLPVLCENIRRMHLLIRSSACLEQNVIHAMDSVEWECGAACHAWICVFVKV